MNCPFCDFAGSRRQVHAHLMAAHRERLAARPEGAGDPAVAVACPVCAEEVSVPFEARSRPPHVREEMEAAAHMVVFDLLLYHLEAAHPSE